MLHAFSFLAKNSRTNEQFTPSDVMLLYKLFPNVVFSSRPMDLRRFLTSSDIHRSTILACCVVVLLFIYILAYIILARRTVSSVRATERSRQKCDDENATSTAREHACARSTGDNNNDFKSNNNADNTDFCRQKRDAFGTARLPAYSRSGIVIPEWSSDTRECDDFRIARGNECLLEDGYAACFECIESRSSLRVCAHVHERLTIYDDVHQTEVTLEPNSSPLMGYCLRETLARQLRDVVNDSPIVEARRECSAHNADWVLVRKRATQDPHDSSFNFVCRCKYPHLMMNIAGPMSSCSRAVGCGSHGLLDEASRNSKIDPFVNGRCLCDVGWISEYNEKNGIGPSCREATIGEWPSLILHRGENKSESYLDLYSMFVDAAFRNILVRNRVDSDQPVYLRDPCSPCPIVATDDGRAYFCGDRFETRLTPRNPYQNPIQTLYKVHIGVRTDRDYLHGNGGQYPNACLTLDEDQIVTNSILVQFMTQEWSKKKFAMEIGIITKSTVIEALAKMNTSPRYFKFLETLQAPDLNLYENCGVVWTFSHPSISRHRERICESLRDFLIGPKYTNLAYKSDSLRVPFAFYIPWITNFYFYFPKETPLSKISKKYFVQQYTYRCPDRRGLDHIYDIQLSLAKETDKEIAHRIARAMLPVCLVDHKQADGITYRRVEINCDHPNDSACLVCRNDGLVTYANQLWIPRSMHMSQYCNERSGWQGHT